MWVPGHSSSSEVQHTLSSGCSTSVQWGGRRTILICSSLASLTVSRLVWLTWPSRIRRISLLSFVSSTNLTKKSWNTLAVTYTVNVSFGVVPESPIHCCISCFPLNTIQGGKTEPSAQMVATTVIFFLLLLAVSNSLLSNKNKCVCLWRMKRKWSLV